MPITKIDCWGLQCPACEEFVDLDGDGMLGRLTPEGAQEEINTLCDGADIERIPDDDEATIRLLCGCQPTPTGEVCAAPLCGRDAFTVERTNDGLELARCPDHSTRDNSRFVRFARAAKEAV